MDRDVATIIAADLATAKKNDQGYHECEVWTTVAEGEKDYKDCSKYPGHKQFVPALEFSLQDLPEPFQNDEVLEYVRFLCERAVRLVVKYTSENRPQGYPFAKSGGQFLSHTGSGLVYCYTYPENFPNEDSSEDKGNGEHDGNKCTKNAQDDSEKTETVDNEEVDNEGVDNDDEDESSDDFIIYEYFDLRGTACPCQECAYSGEPKHQWGQVFLLTAKHVVYDNLEAEWTVAELNFDEKDDTRSLKKLYVTGVSHEDQNKGDWTILNCVTHDRELYIKLYETEKRVSELRDIIHEKYWESKARLALIVSHPHGWVKKVTVGEWTERKVMETNLDGDELVEYRYNTATCRGSSGAPVLVLGMRGSESSFKTWLPQHHVHCGAAKGDDKINFSGVEEERKVDFDDADEESGAAERQTTVAASSE